jgi:quinol monooxygenase YgiN
MQVMIRYKLKPDQVALYLEGLRAIYEEFESAQPGWLRQATFQLEDKVSFVIFTELDDPGRLADMPAFQRARSTLDDRCDEPPVVTVLHKVASYRFT